MPLTHIPHWVTHDLVPMADALGQTAPVEHVLLDWELGMDGSLMVEIAYKNRNTSRWDVVGEVEGSAHAQLQAKRDAQKWHDALERIVRLLHAAIGDKAQKGYFVFRVDTDGPFLSLDLDGNGDVTLLENGRTVATMDAMLGALDALPLPSLGNGGA